jgi:hypothetical protein
MPIVLETQKVTLAGFRILDPRGVVIAGRDEVGQSLAHIEEVATALQGQYRAVLRIRKPDKPPPPIYSISRGVGVHVFSAMPVIVNNRVAGVIYTSRTPSNIFDHLYQERGKFILAALAVVFATIIIGLVFSRTITRPMRELVDRAVRISRGDRDAFRPLAQNKVDLFPKEIEEEHTRLSTFVYENVNNGVYRAGFAVSQKGYERGCTRVFAALDELEKRLAHNRYLFGRRIVEADWRLFCTLIRFDPVYHGHFKCNLRRIVDYPNLQGYLLDLYQQPGIADTVDFDHIKRHYYGTHDDINPTRIVPLGPILDLTRPHGRERLG